VQTRPWFVAKPAPGIGADPATWEGWLATALFCLLLTATTQLMVPGPDSLGGWLRRLPGLHGLVLDLKAMLIAAGVETVLFLALARWKSDGPWLASARRR